MPVKVEKKKIEKAYSVRKNPPLRRKEATSPLSADWRLYDPEQFMEELLSYVNLQDGAHKEDIIRVIERNGFYKATKQREELIKWKVRLQNEIKERNEEKRKLLMQVSRHNDLIRRAQDALVGIRNILRIPREEIPGAKHRK